MFTIRKFTSLLTTLITATSAHAGSFGRLNQVGLSRRSVNAICETQLLVGRNQDRTEAVERFRDHRLHRLYILDEDPVVLRKANLTNRLTPQERRSLAGHLRGIEVWGQRVDGADGPGAGSGAVESPRLAGLTLVGADQIAAYYRELDQRRVDLDGAVARSREVADNGMIAGMLTGLSPIYGGMAGYSLVTGAPPELLVAVGASFAAHGSLTYSANKFRFISDGTRNVFDDGARTYLESDADTQRAKWLFATRTYRVSQALVDAIWNDLNSDFALNDHVFNENFPIVTTVAERLTNRMFGRSQDIQVSADRRRNAYVIVDLLLDYDRQTKEPRLSIVLRTSTKKPSRVTAGFASEGRRSSARTGALAPDFGTRR